MEKQIELIAHRGLWTEPAERNSLAALFSALDNGFGIETDVRPYGEKIVVSHDAPSGVEPEFERLLSYYSENNYSSTLAINIKADGLAERVKKALDDFSISNYFCFDMSLPDHLNYLRAGLSTFGRVSEYEPISSPILKFCDGIWLDAFETEWYTTGDQFQDISRQANRICIVSPELHSRVKSHLWQFLAELKIAEELELMICTDFPKSFMVNG